LSLEPKVGTWDGKMHFPLTHVGKTQKINYKMNVIQINPKANMGMNASIHLHYG
jgi:hypothetical protein